MNFITPLLFVFYLQVMPPPPPPTMHGGGDYWAGRTRNFLRPSQNWGLPQLISALNGVDGDYLPGTYDRAIRYYGLGAGGYESVKQGIRRRYYRNLTVEEWKAFINKAAQISPDEKLEACSIADDNREATSDIAYENLCVPIPKELLLICILSFLLIYYYHNRKEFSKFNFLKSQVNRRF